MSSTDLRDLRKQIIRVGCNAGEAHLPSALSILEIVWTLHNRIMIGHDQCILSKGHGCLALYTVLAQLGRIPQEWLDRYCDDGAELLGHPERRPEVGITATTGSLGHGGSLGVGLAYAARMKKRGMVFCILGDQELNEGSCHESMLIASQLKLDNLVWIIDDNHSADRALRMDSIGAKFLAYGWHVDTCSGHSIDSIEVALGYRHLTKPYCVIANTIKGYGVPLFESDPQQWHHKIPADMRAILESVR